jgi:hypothetical protein
MKKLLAKIKEAIHNFIYPTTWDSLTNDQREDLLSLDSEQRNRLAEAVAQDQLSDFKVGAGSGGHSSGLDTAGAEGADAGGAMGNILGDMRREMIREARRQGERNGR